MWRLVEICRAGAYCPFLGTAILSRPQKVLEQQWRLGSSISKSRIGLKFIVRQGRFFVVRHSPMTLLAFVGASCLAIAIASGDLEPLAEAQGLRADASARLHSAHLAQQRAASRVHDLEAIRAGQLVPVERLDDLRSVVLDVAPPGTGFGVRWTHPLLEIPASTAVRRASEPLLSRSGIHLLAPGQRGPVAAFGLTLIFASVLSGGVDRKIHASSPVLVDKSHQNHRSPGEPVMRATAVLDPNPSSRVEDLEWMPTPADGNGPLGPLGSIDDEEEGDLFYFDDEEDDQEDDEDDGFFFDDDDDDDEDHDSDQSEEDDLESDSDLPPDEDEEEDDSGFAEDDEEEYEFED